MFTAQLCCLVRIQFLVLRWWNLQWLLAAILAVVTISCGVSPPHNVEQYDVFAYTKEKLRQIEQAAYAEEAQGKVLSLYGKVPYIIYAKQGQRIYLIQQLMVPQSDSLVYSLGNGKYRLTRNLYMTMFGAKSYLSFDAQRWFPSAAESTSKGSGVDFRLQFELAAEDKQELTIHYRAELIFRAGAAYSSRKSSFLSKRPVVKGRSGDFFTLDESQADNLQLEVNQSVYDDLMTRVQSPSGQSLLLQDNIVFFPKGFEFYYRILFLGNILKVKTEAEETKVDFLCDVYLYYPQRFFASVSFDGKDWAANYFQFRLLPFGTSVFLDSQNLEYNEGFYIYHK